MEKIYINEPNNRNGIVRDTEDFVDETQSNSRNNSPQIARKDYKRIDPNYRKGQLRPRNTVTNYAIESIEMSSHYGSQNGAKETTYPHVLKDFLQDFTTYDKQFEINNEFNQLNLLDDIHHIKNFVRCNLQDPDMDRYDVLVYIDPTL